MSSIRQMLAVCVLGLATLPQRRATALVIVISLASVVGVLTSMLSVTTGLRQSYLAPEDAVQAIVFASSAEDERLRSLPRSFIPTILDAPGIDRGPGGEPLGDAEFVMGLPPIEGFVDGSLQLRGFGPAGRQLRPRFKIVAGRMFRPGAQEVIAGAGAAKRFGLAVGSNVRLPNGQWPVVGVFTSGGELMENHLVGDADTILAAFRRRDFGAVIVQLVDAKNYPAFESWLSHNPSITVSVQRKSDYDLRLLGATTVFFTQMSYVIGLIMALGALFGVVKIMYAAVRARRQEIATLRAIGFDPAPVAVSVLAEAVVLGALGALVGTALAWLLFDGREITGFGVFKLRVSSALWGIGLAWAIVTSLLGGLFPALRAAQLSPAEALRTE